MNRQKISVLRSVILLFGLLVLASNPATVIAETKLNVVTTTPNLAAIAERVGGDRVEVDSLTSPNRDPHYFNARPSMVVRLNRADLFAKNGLQLEIGWLPELMRQTNNRAIQSGGSAHVDASRKVSPLEVPEGPVDRSQGHVHPEGNPHYTLDPIRARYAAWNITEALETVDSNGSEAYNERLEAFYKEAKSLAEKQASRFGDLSRKGVIVYHQQWEYLLDRLGLEKVDEIEPKPGVPPSASHIASLINEYKDGSVGAVLVAPWSDRGVAKQVAEGIDVPLVEPCPMVGSCENTDTLLTLFRENSNRLHDAISQNND